MSTKISATIIADSKNEFGQRLITYILVFPRIILAELNTHRMFSRNSASSRAIPFKKMLERVLKDPFIPIAWQKDHSGMQGNEYFTGRQEIEKRVTAHLRGRDRAVETAIEQSELGVTKQICNRYLEPFMYHTAIVTATEYENFYALRCPQYEADFGETFRSLPQLAARTAEDSSLFYSIGSQQYMNGMTASFTDALHGGFNKGQGEIHIMALAEEMWNEMHRSQPKLLKAGEWHIPFGDQIDSGRLDEYLSRTESDWNIDSRNSFQDQRRTIVEAMRKIATARCARVSYMNFDGSDDYEKDIALYDRLAASGHMSPFEHVAKAMNEQEYDCWALDIPRNRENPNYLVDRQYGWCGNFRGFIQMRKMIPNENRTV